MTQQSNKKKLGSARPQPRRYSPEERAAARALYEFDPKKSLRKVAAETGIPYETISSWAAGQRGNGGKWNKLVDGMSEEAHLLANKHRTRLSELGPSLSVEQEVVAEKETVELAAVEARAKIIERHRTEWNAPRTLAYEAIKGRDMDKAKLAKIAAETLKLVQEGERKAWGLDVGADNRVTVTVERV